MLEVQELTKKYGKNVAVDHVSFMVQDGQVGILLGPNGAGKSTTIKMLTGILVPNSGMIKVFGKDPLKYRKENSKHIGVVFGQKSQLWWDIPAIESLELLKEIGLTSNLVTLL